MRKHRSNALVVAPLVAAAVFIPHRMAKAAGVPRGFRLITVPFWLLIILFIIFGLGSIL